MPETINYYLDKLKLLMPLRQMGKVLICFYAEIFQRHKIKKYFKFNTSKKLQLGCGLNLINGWLNTDYSPRSSKVVFLDAGKRFPFPANIFDYVFAEHLIEHLELGAGVKMMRECYRVLKSGGILRIATPDFRFLMDLYMKDKSDIQKRYIKWAVDSRFPGAKIYRDIIVINNFFTNFGHRFIYDYDLLAHLLEDAGFRNVRRCIPGDSVHAPLKDIEKHGRLISEEYNLLETVVAEACKD